MLGLTVVGSTARPRYTLAAAATVLHFSRVPSASGADKELEVISALGRFLGPQPGGFHVPWRSTDCWLLGENAGMSLSTDVTLSA